jgi:subtilisin-like proprotein convertase family protein
MKSGPSNARRWRGAIGVAGGLVLAEAAGAPAAAAERHVTEVFKAGGGGRAFFGQFTNPAAITINDNAPAALYPSNIEVAGQVSTLNEASVVLNGLTHPFPGDLDVMLVSPAGTRVMLHSDAGAGFSVSALDYGFANSQDFGLFVHIPEAAAITSRIYLPADYGTGLEVMPPPAPPGVYHVSTYAFAGEDPNGTWSLYVRDDAQGGIGTVAGGWTLSLDMNVRRAATAIPGTGTDGPAAPYPAPIFVSTNTAHGRISKLRVVLSNVSHSFPDDIDVLLQGPDGQTVLLWSDAGGAANPLGATFTFEDGAPLMPNDGPLPTGTYGPTNIGTGDTFPAPAPAGPYGNTLSRWNNTRPFGPWNLWVVDDSGIAVGSFGDWALEITTVEKGDFNRDANVDLLWRHDTSGENALWYMEGTRLFTGEFTNPPVLPDVRWKIVGTHDFNGDGRTDILWRHTTSGENVMWFTDKNTLVSGTFTNPAALADVKWQMAATGDFNADAKPDILWRHDVSGQMVVWLMNGHTLVGGGFTIPSAADPDWKIVGTGYFNPGRLLDVLVWHQPSGQLGIWYMDGFTIVSVGSPTPAGLPDTRWRPVVTGDYNRDGRVDIVWRHETSGQIAVWYMGGPGGSTMTGGVLTEPPVLADARWKIVGPR